MGGLTLEPQITAKVYPAPDEFLELESDHPKNRVDYRDRKGPLLELLWSEEEPLQGQTLYLGGEVGIDGKIYCIPGHGKALIFFFLDTFEIFSTITLP